MRNLLEPIGLLLKMSYFRMCQMAMQQAVQQNGSLNLYTEHKINSESSPLQLEGFFAALCHMIPIER